MDKITNENFQKYIFSFLFRTFVEIYHLNIYKYHEKNCSFFTFNYRIHINYM